MLSAILGKQTEMIVDVSVKSTFISSEPVLALGWGEKPRTLRQHVQPRQTGLYLMKGPSSMRIWQSNSINVLVTRRLRGVPMLEHQRFPAMA